MEVAGVILGAIPLIISAMEYYPRAQELGIQIWKFRRTRQDELRRVAFCKELLNLHLQALLQLNSAQVQMLSRNPVAGIWDDAGVEEQLKQRLAGSYDAYSGILDITETQMAQIMEAAKVDDEAFKLYLMSNVANPSDAESLKIRAAAFCRKFAIQPRIGVHVMGHRRREMLLEKLEASIKRLKELLEAVDGVSEANKTQQLARNYRIPLATQGYWHRAKKIWQLIHEHFHCGCRSKHCARLWIDRSSMAQDSVGLVFLFDKAVPRTAEPWKRFRLEIQRSGSQCSCDSRSTQQKAEQKRSSAIPTITVQPPDAGSLSGSGQALEVPSTAVTMPSLPSMSTNGLCEMFKHHNGHACLGTLCTTDDNSPYHFLPDHDKEFYDFVPLASMLGPDARPFFELRPRIRLAAMLASAHLRFFCTPWVPDRWKLHDIFFPKDPQDASKVNIDMPFILADFQGRSATTVQDMSTTDQGFVSLGITLLELCFGRPLEMHEMWSKANGRLNLADPFHRQYVAGEWAKKIDQVIDGPEYTKAVKWCLSDAPTDEKDEKWREDFAMNVLGPLLKSAKLL